MQWEFAYVDLWLGHHKTIDSVGERKGEIARLGKEGWEPVGEIRFMFREPQHGLGGETNVRQLMFKRLSKNL